MADTSEQAVGISVYANSCPGFTAILKHRFADFKVNEVNLEGQVVRLTSLDPPEASAQLSAGDAVPDAAADPDSAIAAVVQQYAAVSGASGTQLEPLRSFLQQALQHQQAPTKPPPPPPLVLEPAIAAKEQRTAVHRLFKTLPGFPCLETNTLGQQAQQQQVAKQQEQGAQAGQQEPQQQPTQQGGTDEPAAGKAQHIQVQVAGGCGGGRSGRGQKRKRRDDSWWPGGSMRYLKFVLFKENMDSQHALSVLTKLLRVKHKLFAVAGTKDKRGITVQQVTAYRLDPTRLAALNTRLRGMRVGNFEFATDQLRLGDLQGNRFELILRNIEAESIEVVAAAAQGLRCSGFINYYGLQRFGTGAVPTHRVGQALLGGQWQEAVRLLLTPRNDCPRPEQAEASRLYLEQGDVEGALRLMPQFLVAEPTLLQGLKQHGPNGYLNALMMLPRNLRTIFIHAYQSYLWNAAASHRIQTYGADSVVAGDLVLPYGAAPRTAGRDRGRQQEPAAASAAAEEGDVGTGTAEEVEEEQDLWGDVHVVTAEEAVECVWRIEDVVLPLPGYEVCYPQHASAEVYRELAARDGVSLDSSPHGAKNFSMTELTGAYRHLLHRPQDLEFELMRYSCTDADLALSDLQELQGQQLPPPVASEDEPRGPYLGLRLAFTLPSSCYATMLIRELTKQPTSTAYHRAMQHRDPASAGSEAKATPAGAP